MVLGDVFLGRGLVEAKEEEGVEEKKKKNKRKKESGGQVSQRKGK